MCYESSSLSGTRLNNAKVFAAHLMQDTHKNSPSQQIYMDLFPKMQIKLKPIGEVFFFFCTLQAWREETEDNTVGHEDRQRQ